MTKEEKQLLLIDLCARLPYRVKINVNGEEDTLLELGADTGWVNASYDIEDVKPYLRPMSSMTEKEIEESENFVIPSEEDENGNYQIGVLEKDIPNYINWLNTHHFDYRGLIERGLALEAPKGMYKELI